MCSQSIIGPGKSLSMPIPKLRDRKEVGEVFSVITQTEICYWCMLVLWLSRPGLRAILNTEKPTICTPCTIVWHLHFCRDILCHRREVILEIPLTYQNSCCHLRRPSTHFSSSVAVRKVDSQVSLLIHLSKWTVTENSYWTPIYYPGPPLGSRPSIREQVPIPHRTLSSGKAGMWEINFSIRYHMLFLKTPKVNDC